MIISALTRPFEWIGRHHLSPVLPQAPLGVGLLAFAKTRRGHRRHRWIAVAGVLAVLGGSLVMVQAKAALWGAADDATWFIVVMGLLPIALGAVSLVRWSRL